MPLFHLILVALIQGATEFLPISSSGHLILLPSLTGLEDQGQVIDVAVHLGSLFAVVLYFRRDMALAATGLADLARGRRQTEGARLALWLALATVPVVLAGLALHLTGLDAAMRSAAVIGWSMLLFGLLLWWADARFPQRRSAESRGWRDAWTLGLWQALALIPGTSRAGICITGGRIAGFDREGAARLAMLMSVPTILASAGLLGAETLVQADAAMLRDGAVAAGFAFLAALGALALMMRLLRSVSFLPYVIYRVALGLVLLAWAYG